MAGRHLGPFRLDEAERAELQSLSSRRSTAQALALRARIVLACAEGEQSKAVAARLAVDPIRLASGVGASPSTDLKAFVMSPGPARPAPWRMLGSRQ